MLFKILLFCFFVMSIAQLAFGQAATGINELQQLKNEVATLRAQLDSIITEQQTIQSIQDDERERLEEQLDKRLQELERKIDAVSRSTAPIILNPRTTAFINVAGRLDRQDELDYTGTTLISNKMYLRSFELEMRNPVDPYAEAIAIISVEDEAGTGYVVDPEEVYGLIKRLPLLEDAPLGLKLKIGKFRAPLGVSNKVHLHDLPWTTRPLIISRFLGTEFGEFFESGFNPVGLDFDFMLPTTAFTTEMNISFVNGGTLGLSNNINAQNTALVTHLNLSEDWNNEHLLNVGFSFYGEGNFLTMETPHDPSYISLLGADLTYKWAPAERRTERSLVFGGEVFFTSYGMTDTNSVAVINNPFGWYSYAQYQTSYWLYLGARFDWVQEPMLAKPVTQTFAAYASYYTTEFLRFRIGYEQRWSELPQLDNLRSLMFDINFVFGSHPTEPYWVNR